jgi:hypothetical protein
MGLMMIHKPSSDLLLVPSSVCRCGCSSLVSCSCSFQGIVYERKLREERLVVFCLVLRKKTGEMDLLRH